jgi:hypothetical protein
MGKYSKQRSRAPVITTTLPLTRPECESSWSSEIWLIVLVVGLEGDSVLEEGNAGKTQRSEMKTVSVLYTAILRECQFCVFTRKVNDPAD